MAASINTTVVLYDRDTRAGLEDWIANKEYKYERKLWPRGIFTVAETKKYTKRVRRRLSLNEHHKIRDICAVLSRW